MIVRVKNLNVNLDLLRPIGHGKDGDLYLFQDLVIKINKSQHMTEEKVMDLQVARESKRLIIPLDIINPTPSEFLRAENPCFGYTTRYLPEDKYALLDLTTQEYLDQLEFIKGEVNKYFSPYGIAITDTNPHNMLVSNGIIYLIDFDRNVTKSSMYPSREIILKNGHDKPFEFHNNCKLYMLTYRGLLLTIAQYYQREKQGNRDKIKEYILERQESPEKFEFFTNELLRHKYMHDYAKEKVKMISR